MWGLSVKDENDANAEPILICIRIPCAFVQKVVPAVQFLYIREK